MSSSVKTLLLAACLLPALALAQPASAALAGIGRMATPAEVKAWDIDVRPDFKGLPTGQGSVRRGEQVWEAQCASCHGAFGESNDIFAPLVGHTTRKDVETGRVAALQLGTNTPSRTMMMKASQLSTLWDYINRAMPWTAPKSLSADDVYAVLAYLLNLGHVVPDDFTLSDRNIREVQQRLPNRNGITTVHGMWPGPEFGGHRRPDVQGSACMRNCGPAPVVASQIPDYARNAHGELATQMRTVGPVRGVRTSPAAEENNAATRTSTAQAATKSVAGDVLPLLQKYACTACHGVDSKIVGPSFRDVAGKYGAQADAVAYLAGRIRSGGQGVWGAIPMPPQSISEADARRVAEWLGAGAAP